MTKARTLADNFAADINAVTAGTGITGGGTSGTVTVTNSMATAIDAKGDLVVGTGADTFSRLAVASTAGYLLSVDSGETTGLKWAAPASASGLTLINTTSFSAVSSQSINSVFTSTYTNYQVLFNLTSASANSNSIVLRLRASGSDATGSDYFRAGYINYNGTVNNNYGTTTSWQIGNPLVAGSGAAVMTIYRPNVADTTQISLASTQFADTGTQYSGNHTLTTAYDGLTILTTGAETITGTVSIYGYAK